MTTTNRQLQAGDTVLRAGHSDGPRYFGRVLLIDGALVKVQWPRFVDWCAPGALDYHPMPSDRISR